MGFADKIRRLCALKGLDQSTLAERIGISKSSMSRILSGLQEPKLRLAHELARALGVTMDYLADESDQDTPGDQMVELSDDERTILKIVRRLGHSLAMDRLVGINVPAPRREGTAAKRSAVAPGRNKRSHRRSSH
jgi:transcriptional regulator with XRE-family HTH domain